MESSKRKVLQAAKSGNASGAPRLYLFSLLFESVLILPPKPHVTFGPQRPISLRLRASLRPVGFLWIFRRIAAFVSLGESQVSSTFLAYPYH